MLNCPQKFIARVEKIEACYLASLYDDIQRETPLLAGIKDAPGITIGHLATDPPSFGLLLGKVGFYDVLSESGLDFVIGTSPTSWSPDMTCFFIPMSMGYAIHNYDGIRFAIFVQDRDSLIIRDEIQMTLVRQRSDVMWVLDKKLLSLPPIKLDFFIKDRILIDTAMTTLDLTPDTNILKTLHSFKRTLNVVLNDPIDLGNQTVETYIFSRIAAREDVNVIIYPNDLFHNGVEQSSPTLREILQQVRFEQMFTKIQLSAQETTELTEEHNYRLWGTPTQSNQALVPADSGSYLLDLFYHGDEHGE
jgi:hypothetical protein